MKTPAPPHSQLGAVTLLSRRRLLARAGAAALAGYCLPGLIIGEAHAQEVGFDFYIGPSGSDSNPGTLAQPWALTAINTKRATYAGKRVGLLNGTYNVVAIAGQPFDPSWVNNHLAVAAGSSGRPTVIKAVNPPSGGVWNVVLDGQRSSLVGDAQQGVIGPLYSGGSAAYVTIDGIEIRGANYQAIHSHDNGSYLTIQNCYIHDQIYTTNPGGGKNSATISCVGTTGVVIRNNLIENCAAPSDNDRHDFILFYGSNDAIVEYNTIQNVGAGGNGVYYKSAGVPNKRMITRWNLINRTGSTNKNAAFGILYTGSNVSTDEEKIYGNIVHGGPGRPCFSLIAAGDSGIVSLYNNTFVGDWSGDGGCNLSAGPPATVNFYNNILSRSATGYNGDLNLAPGTALGTFDNNLYDSSPALAIVRGGTLYSTLASWQSASGKDTRSQINSNPLFVGTGSFADSYKLLAGSLARTLGVGGIEIGAWGSGSLQIGCSFSRSGVTPVAPALISIG